MRKADFAITPNGDLIFTSNVVNKERTNIEFYLTQTKALRIDFNTSHIENDDFVDNRLTINFNTVTRHNDKRTKIISDNEYLEQQVLISLKTPLGEMPNRKNIGSELESSMHKDMYDTKVLNQIETKVFKAINGKIENCIIKAFPGIEKDHTYKQVVNVKIYSDDTTINYQI